MYVCIFQHMINENEAESAIAELTGTLVRGSRMRVEVSISDTDNTRVRPHKRSCVYCNMSGEKMGR